MGLQRRAVGATASAACALALLACHWDEATPEAGPLEAGPDAVAEFSLPDVNATSATFSQDVSPRDFLGAVSAWYFGHAT